MISEENLIFSSFVENTLEYYRNVLLLIILKGLYSPSNLRDLVYVNNITKNVIDVHQYLLQR